MTLDVTIYDDSDSPVDVFAKFTPARKGSRDQYGVSMEPDDEAEIEILDAVAADGTSVNLNKDEIQRAREAVWEVIKEQDDDQAQPPQ